MFCWCEWGIRLVQIFLEILWTPLHTNHWSVYKSIKKFIKRRSRQRGDKVTTKMTWWVKSATTGTSSLLKLKMVNDSNRILEQIKTNTQRVFNTTKDRQKQKFEKLMREKQAAVSPIDTSYVDTSNWFINLSSRSLSDAEIALLKKGLNLSLPRRLSPRSNQLSDNSTPNKQTLSEELLTTSFNRKYHQSLTSRRRCETRLNT